METFLAGGNDGIAWPHRGDHKW